MALSWDKICNFLISIASAVYLLEKTKSIIGIAGNNKAGYQKKILSIFINLQYARNMPNLLKNDDIMI